MKSLQKMIRSDGVQFWIKTSRRQLWTVPLFEAYERIYFYGLTKRGKINFCS